MPKSAGACRHGPKIYHNPTESFASGSKVLNIALWAAQIILAAAYGLFGSMKAFSPIAQIAPMMK